MLNRCKVDQAETCTALQTVVFPLPREWQWRLVAVVTTALVSFSEQVGRDGQDQVLLQEG